jgi:hypothetical protein
MVGDAGRGDAATVDHDEKASPGGSTRARMFASAKKPLGKAGEKQRTKDERFFVRFAFIRD